MPKIRIVKGVKHNNGGLAEVDKNISRPSIMRPKDMAQDLGVGLNFIYRELKAGRIPSTKIGDSYFLSRDAWEKFLAGNQLKVDNGTKK
jgi:excisionase family DNA binding protein